MVVDKEVEGRTAVVNAPLLASPSAGALRGLSICRYHGVTYSPHNAHAPCVKVRRHNGGRAKPQSQGWRRWITCHPHCRRAVCVHGHGLKGMKRGETGRQAHICQTTQGCMYKLHKRGVGQGVGLGYNTESTYKQDG